VGIFGYLSCFETGMDKKLDSSEIRHFERDRRKPDTKVIYFRNNNGSERIVLSGWTC